MSAFNSSSAADTRILRRLLINTAIFLVLILVLLPGYVAAQATRSTPSTVTDQEFTLAVEVRAPDGSPIRGVLARVGSGTLITDSQGRLRTSLPEGDYKLQLSTPGYAPLALAVSVRADTDLKITLQPGGMVTVRPEPDVLSPDPSTRIMSHEDVLDANPGRPGVPISIPGLPSETASGGIKAPQYFAPGVAGDHGEPVAQFFGIGDFLFPNNLTANAHGNGYGDPNVLIPAVIGSVQADGGAYNVRYGDHAINLAIDYSVRQRMNSFVQTTGDYRDFDLVTGWSPRNPATRGWLAFETGFGNGFLARPENRQQHKINAYRAFTRGKHDLTIFGIGYYGFSRIPGLVPIGVPVLGDTIDPRQSDLTHTSLLVVSDTWNRTNKQQFQFAGYFRTYSLRLLSNFGDGLIRQSEFRTMAGGNTSYLLKPTKNFSLLAGADVRRDAPRGLNLDRADGSGVFHSVTRNDLTISSVSPFATIDGKLSRYLQYYVGVRRDQFAFDNTDLLNHANSYTVHPGITSPKTTLVFLPPTKTRLPVLALSYGQAFHVNDPRIGTGTDRGTPIAKSRAYQLAATEFVAGTVFSMTLAHVTNSAQLAKIDPDTGLQQNVGPSVVRSITFSASRHFPFGFIQGSFSRANAINRITGQPIPEAPRLIWDAVGAVDRLLLGLHAKGEFEYVGRKPLGDGFNALPVREIRGYLGRSFNEGRFDVGLNFLLAQGYSGQTLETLQLAGELAPFERTVGVRLKSYASVSLTYHFTATRQQHSRPHQQAAQ